MELINKESHKPNSLSISRMCKVLSINRTDYYRWLKNKSDKPNDVD